MIPPDECAASLAPGGGAGLDPQLVAWWDAGRPWLFGVLAVLLLGWLLSGESRLREARRLVLSQAAFLVPAGLAVLLLFLTRLGLAHYGHLGSGPFHENPVGLRGAEGIGQGGAANLLALLIVALTLAGHIGLLEAQRVGRRPDGFAFWHGVRRHTITLSFAKFLIAAAVWVLSTWVRPGGMALMLFLLPSLMLAPLPGILSRTRDGQRAISTAIEHAYHHLGTVAWRVILLLMFCVGLLQIQARLLGGSADPGLLTVSSSTLSWNLFPYAMLGGPIAWNIFLTLAAATFATISVTAHWLDLNRPADAADAAGRADLVDAA